VRAANFVPGKRITGKEEIMETATFAAGCFWCVEAVFSGLRGVQKVMSGYTGGQTEKPTYEQVCTGMTGHAEAIQITFDPAVITYEELLEVFWYTHDPTTPNQQGPDVGTQYRSAVFFHSEEQRSAAEAYKRKLEESGVWNRPIVTEIVPFRAFHPAEAYHQNYYLDHPKQSYCWMVINPKLVKFRQRFADKLKKSGD
jgi:peptide-methionine (S)-S-oxide reductase